MPRIPWPGGGAPEDDRDARARLMRALRGERAPVTDPVPAPVPDEGDADADQIAAPATVLVDPARRGAGALVAVALVALVVTGAVAWRSRAQPLTVAAPVVVTSTASAAPGGEVVVDVQGAVRRPGLVHLPAGARVADAIAAAGGLRPGASTAGLNLARKLSDGEQVVVLPPGAAAAAAAAPASGTAASATSGGRLDLNLATLEQLDALPGVGPVTAKRIIAWRTEHGRFASIDQLREVDGIGDKRFDALRELVTV
jgi:competence protein ComEA